MLLLFVVGLVVLVSGLFGVTGVSGVTGLLGSLGFGVTGSILINLFGIGNLPVSSSTIIVVLVVPK